jgi:hypothetical protein
MITTPPLPQPLANVGAKQPAAAAAAAPKPLAAATA